ncbi:hypothetical protein COU57_03985 [Candidatus Pacearchaeota archaeon CG10_big_fil_rev_8_21_14_0_10_32_14]|nr:MAG: hypothetical protein COU57_03985 [Candidatus Pacearchaeota archaeon CG10_big_fil_rev_8_21_14_0_10_32_14]
MEIAEYAVFGRRLGQLKIQQMAFMLIAIMIFFVLIGMFFMVYQVSNLRAKATELEEQNARKLISKLANSPEFSCGRSFRDGEVDCVDFDKLMILKDQSKNYGDFWGVAEIQIEKIYPKLLSNVTCSFQNYPNCRDITIYNEKVNKKSYVTNYVALCRKDIYNREETKNIEVCELAKIKIRYENKEIAK